MKTRRDIYQAIADPTRRAILALLATGALTPGAIANHFNSSRQTISKHIQILTECELVTQEPNKREIYYRLNPQKLDEIDHWLEQFKRTMESSFDNLESYLMEMQQEASFEIKHVFEADLPTVFDMWISPDSLSKWLGPDGARMTVLSADVREGGNARWEMSTDDGLTKYGQLSYKIINPASHLIYIQHFCDKKGRFVKAPFSATYPDYLLTTVHFEKEAEGRTRVMVKWEIFGEATEIERQTFLAMRTSMHTGWMASFGKLEKLLK